LVCLSLFVLPSMVHASECDSDEDCNADEYCQVVGSTGEVVCFVAEDGTEECEDVPAEEESFGFCELRPIECQTDSDCPSHLECSTYDDFEDGEVRPAEMIPPPPVDDSEEDPDGVPADDLPPEEMEIDGEDEGGMCVYNPAECETDNDCGMNFHCQIETFVEGCVFPAAPDCAEEDEDCVDTFEVPEECDEREWTEGYCQPDEIECDSDAACPSDWSCKQIEEYACEEVTVSREAPEPSDGDEEAAQVPDFNDIPCEEIVRSLCVPLGVHEGYLTGSASLSSETDVVDGEPNSTPSSEEDPDSEGGEPGTEEGEPRTEEGSSNADLEEDSGCDAKSTSPTPLALFGLLALVGLRRRLA